MPCLPIFCLNGASQDFGAVAAGIIAGRSSRSVGDSFDEPEFLCGSWLQKAISTPVSSLQFSGVKSELLRTVTRREFAGINTARPSCRPEADPPKLSSEIETPRPTKHLCTTRFEAVSLVRALVPDMGR
ncbi:hypothetical protein E2P81_ATG11141 [Venturia nashicola]|nr:hypothetical protein E2P81_ATG11141 [Venturia nashicola]